MRLRIDVGMAAACAKWRMCDTCEGSRQVILCCKTHALGTHRESARSRRAQRLGQIGELAEQPARIARVDDLFDPERLRGAERRAQRIQPRLDLGKLGSGSGAASISAR